MRSIRLLPLVVLAASALLVLKSIGILTGDGYTLTGVPLVAAQEQGQGEGDAGASEAGEVEGYTDEQLAAADAAADALFSGVEGRNFDELIDYYQLDGTGFDSPLGEGAQTTEQVILQRLAERRMELDALEQELDARLSLVEAAELRLEERMSEIAAVENRINALVEAKETEQSEQFASVVAMYAAMRPADAATIFNDLDMTVLTRVGRAMNPRVLGPIMARMLPERAQQLTVRLATNEEPPTPAQAPSTEFSHLPQIMGE